MASRSFVAVTGATGFIGRALTPALLDVGYHVVALTRSADRAASVLPGGVDIVEWDGKSDLPLNHALEECEAFINLMGENIAGLWTKGKRNALLESRSDSTRAIARHIAGARGRIRCFIQASAVGYYGSRGEEELSEESSPGEGLLAKVARSSEAAAFEVRLPGVRVATIRTGLVFGRSGGTLPLMSLPVRLGLGGFPGKGANWVSWIHLDDEVQAIRFLLENEIEGPFNLTAPSPVRMRELMRALGSILRRPVWLRIPPAALRLALGPVADEALLCSQRATPGRLVAHGFQFRFPDLESALSNLLATPG